MVVVVVEMRIHIVAAVMHRGDIHWRFWLPREIRLVLQLGLYVLLYWAMVDGLNWSTILACSAIKSLTEWVVGQFSPW